MTPSTTLLKKDSSSRRRPVGEEGVESLVVDGAWRWELKSSLSMPLDLTLRLELREGMLGEHDHSGDLKRGWLVVNSKMYRTVAVIMSHDRTRLSAYG